MLAILVPVFNEAAVVDLFFQRLRPVVGTLSERYRVRLVFLNNASSDATLERVHGLSREWPDTFVITMSRNVGYQRSLELGLRTVEADHYVIIDVDCEDPPEMILQLSRSMEQGADIAFGVRSDRQEPEFIKFCRRVFYRLLQRVADEDIILDMAEFSMFTQEVRDAILQENSSFPFLRASIARVGFVRVGIPYTREKRIGGQTHYNVIGMIIFAAAGILSSSTLLLRIPIYVFPFWALSLTWLWVVFGRSGAMWAAAAAMWLTAMFLGFTVASIALYVARSYKNGLQRPNAFVKTSLSRFPPTGR